MSGKITEFPARYAGDPSGCWIVEPEQGPLRVECSFNLYLETKEMALSRLRASIDDALDHYLDAFESRIRPGSRPPD